MTPGRINLVGSATNLPSGSLSDTARAEVCLQNGIFEKEKEKGIRIMQDQSEVLVSLLSRTPPQMLLAYLAFVAGMKPGEILHRFAAVRLVEMLQSLEIQFEQQSSSAGDPLSYLSWFKLIAGRLDNTLNDLVNGASSPEKTVAGWIREVEAIILVARTLAEVPGTFEQLIERNKWLRGHIRARMPDGFGLERVIDDAWNRIGQKLNSFDPAKGEFRTWALIWADYAIDHHLKDVSSPPGFLDHLAPGYQNQRPWAVHDPEAPIFPEFLDHLQFALKEVFNRADTPPHQLLAFLLSFLLRWRPAEIFQELGTQPMGVLLLRIKRDLVEKLDWPQAYVDDLLGGLGRKLAVGLSVDDSVVTERTQVSDRLKPQTGETSLLTWCTRPGDRQRFNQDFSDWATSVMDRLRAEMFDGSECESRWS